MTAVVHRGPRRVVAEAMVSVVETLLRMVPFPTATGLRRVGNPGPESPVVLTGNLRLTVQRVRRSLRGVDAWLLVANSRGVNVWCAATGGLFTEHDVVSVLKTSRISERVNHQRVVLPQLAATGVDGRAVRRRTGWHVVWGPVEATDLPEFLRAETRHSRAPDGPEARAMRTVGFPLRRRFEMAAAWAFPLSVPVLALLPFQPGAMLPAVALVWGSALTVFGAFPLYRRWLHTTSRRSVGGLTLDLGPLAVVGAAWAILVGAWLAVGALADVLHVSVGWPWLVGSLVVLVVLGVERAWCSARSTPSVSPRPTAPASRRK